MKRILKLAVMAITIVLASCEKDDVDVDERNDLPMEFTVDGYSDVSVDGELEVLFNQDTSNRSSSTNSITKQSSSNPGDFTVKIYATPEQREKIQITSENGILYISSEDGIQLSDGVIVELFAQDLEEIRLESNQEADFIGIIERDLVVVTEANSKLRLLDIQVDHLIAKTEGESELTVTTFSEDFDTDQTFNEERGFLIDENTLLIDNIFVYRGENVSLDDGTWTVGGEDIFSNFRILTTDYKTEGETHIDASFAVSETVDINLEGNSQAAVWALDRITGKGEGSSHLYYRPVGGLDISGFITEGESQVSPLPFD